MEVGVQANLGLSKKEEIFQQEYVQRVTELRGQLSEKCDEVREFEQLVKRLRNDVRALERELVNTRANARLPETIVVAPKGERYHLPGCGNLTHSTSRAYTPCLHCTRRQG